ncbi:ATP-binding protein [Sphingomonas morindae]|uniref:histidine kinase n=1 Tax=Sphingomonas morindae TaxID=1541170 RepID=A0ABY4X8M3_9SPHN|nr:ATP-binding protein [Sphingomonas morindae]USI73010.1 response regulator [Sphingomonas morindae]
MRTLTRSVSDASPFAQRLDAGRVIAIGVALLGIASAVLIAQAIGNWHFGLGFLIGFGVVIAIALVAGRASGRSRIARGGDTDRALIRAALDIGQEPVAITDRAGRLLFANRAYLDRFGPSAVPPDMPGLAVESEAIADVGTEAWRDGAAEMLMGPTGIRLSAQRVGTGEDHLLWRVSDGRGGLRDQAAALIGGGFGDRLGRVGLMVALADERGRVLAANRVFAARALGAAGASVEGRDFTALLGQTEQGALRFAREEGRDPLRLLHVPLEGDDAARGAALMLLFDDPGDPSALAAAAATKPSDVYDLLGMLPLGLALVDRDGRFLFLNAAFARAAGIAEEERPIYPGDLVVKEDKAAVADAVRRFAGSKPPTALAGQSPILSGDIAVRLARRPEEAVSLTVASARGLGPAAVLLSLKDSGEETRLKRQVNQANKMQAVGQLAGGIAHDFNNILTALIGHCDLMLMRHTPGDSDYDDIHQIRHNANRAAGLTRQLLAFSRQQTLRPQTLQLPDVVSEVSNLLKRLLGDKTHLEISHGRALGAVRADPGQLEQVIVNLAVNARDAMPDGGTITVRTYSVSAAEVRRLGSDILPIGDYTALSVTDTGTGIAPADLPKIFEPFFTTKEVGKGTGLGLSTVYGIVKQSGGFIFADSELGRGTSFVIYLPVFEGAAAPEAVVERDKPAPALWGSGSILVVEDEDMVRSVAERALTRQGYQVRTAANGEEGLEVLAQVTAEGGHFDLLISDVMMPSMDGPTMAGLARERFPRLPVLFMSGYAEEQLRKSISLENISFLPKPFSVQQLAEAARDALGRSEAR